MLFLCSAIKLWYSFVSFVCVLNECVYSPMCEVLSVMTVQGKLICPAHKKKTPTRRVNKISVTKQYVPQCSKVFKKGSDQDVFQGRVEMDSHADTFIAGRNCLLMHYTERVCDVMPYSEDYEAKTAVPIVQVATGFTNAAGERFILIVNEAIWMPEMENSLANPNQLRDYGTEVQDNPYAEDPMVVRADYDGNDFVACLRSQGTVVYLNTWTPTHKDLASCPKKY